jgi:hypothetical protein
MPPQCLYVAGSSCSSCAVHPCLQILIAWCGGVALHVHLLYVPVLLLLRRADPQRRAAALETLARGELTMQGPVTLLQGWRGAVARLPVFIANVSRNDTFKCVMTSAAAMFAMYDLCYSAAFCDQCVTTML